MNTVISDKYNSLYAFIKYEIDAFRQIDTIEWAYWNAPDFLNWVRDYLYEHSHPLYGLIMSYIRHAEECDDPIDVICLADNVSYYVVQDKKAQKDLEKAYVKVLTQNYNTSTAKV